MRIRTRSAAFLALAVVMASCSDSGFTGLQSSGYPQLATLAAAAMPAVRISEIHYDNAGTDADERIEISGPAGTSLTGWSVVLYNGNGGASYNTQALSGTIPATCGPRGVVVLTYLVNGIQNGGSATAPEADGIALVNGTTVIEFLSYEAVMTATNGPAAGMVSTNIGVAELGNEPVGQSLKRNGNDTWSGPSAHSFGSCNDDTEVPPAIVATVAVTPAEATIAQGATQQFNAAASDAAGQPIGGTTFTWSTTAPAVATVSQSGLATGVAAGDARIIAAAPNGVADTADIHVSAPPPTDSKLVWFNEIHYDDVGADIDERIEIAGPAGLNVTGWKIYLYNGNGGVVYAPTFTLAGTIPATCGDRGVIVQAYDPAAGIQNGAPDGMALVDATGAVVQFISYEGVFTATDGPAAGMVATDIGVSENGEPEGQSIKRNGDGTWSRPSAHSFGACNAEVVPPGGGSILFTGRTPSEPPLPVGFQDQLFATIRDGSGATVTTTVVWSSETPAIASIDQNGVMTALAAGTAIIRATGGNGTTATYALPTRVAVASTTALYEGNAEFGEPTDANASDDFIIRRDQYTASYNRTRGIPNWVSYEIDPSHFGPEDRCECFTTDPLLPSAFPSYTTADYTGSGAFHGYGIDRGHLARSFDRTSGSLDNASTFYFSNIIPQAADLNQGPWALMENYLGDLARLQNKEVYVIAGPAGSKGTLKNEGKVTIPTHVWKVAVILPHDQGLEDIDDRSDFEVIAVIAPNEPGGRNVPWETYRTTVDAVEALSGYDLLALLRDDIELAAESGTLRPDAAVNGPFSSTEGAAVPMSAAASTDADGDALTFAWTFGDGGVASGATVSHTYAQDGSYTVRLIATDIRGLADTVTTTALVTNVAPVFAPASGATIDQGATYTGSGAFTDPGADNFTATVDYGDGSGTRALSLSGKSFSLSHEYATAGSYTITVRVSDDDVTAVQTRTIRVLSIAEMITEVAGQIEQLAASGRIPKGFANSVTTRLESMDARLDRHSDKTVSVVMQLMAMNTQLDAMVRSGQMSSADATVVRAAIARVLRVVQD